MQRSYYDYGGGKGSGGGMGDSWGSTKQPTDSYSTSGSGNDNAYGYSNHGTGGSYGYSGNDRSYGDGVGQGSRSSYDNYYSYNDNRSQNTSSTSFNNDNQAIGSKAIPMATSWQYCDYCSVSLPSEKAYAEHIIGLSHMRNRIAAEDSKSTAAYSTQNVNDGRKDSYDDRDSYSYQTSGGTDYYGNRQAGNTHQYHARDGGANDYRSRRDQFEMKGTSAGKWDSDYRTPAQKRDKSADYFQTPKLRNNDYKPYSPERVRYSPGRADYPYGGDNKRGAERGYGSGTQNRQQAGQGGVGYNPQSSDIGYSGDNTYQSSGRQGHNDNRGPLADDLDYNSRYPKQKKALVETTPVIPLMRDNDMTGQGYSDYQPRSNIAADNTFRSNTFQSNQSDFNRNTMTSQSQRGAQNYFGNNTDQRASSGGRGADHFMRQTDDRYQSGSQGFGGGKVSSFGSQQSQGSGFGQTDSMSGMNTFSNTASSSTNVLSEVPWLKSKSDRGYNQQGRDEYDNSYKDRDLRQREQEYFGHSNRGQSNFDQRGNFDQKEPGFNQPAQGDFDQRGRADVSFGQRDQPRFQDQQNRGQEYFGQRDQKGRNFNQQGNQRDEFGQRGQQNKGNFGQRDKQTERFGQNRNQKPGFGERDNQNNRNSRQTGNEMRENTGQIFNKQRGNVQRQQTTSPGRGQAIKPNGSNNSTSQPPQRRDNKTNQPANQEKPNQKQADKKKCLVCNITVLGNTWTEHCNSNMHIVKLLILKENFESEEFTKKCGKECLPTLKDYKTGVTGTLNKYLFYMPGSKSGSSNEDVRAYIDFVLQSGKDNGYTCKVCNRALEQEAVWLAHIMGSIHARECVAAKKNLGLAEYNSRYGLLPGPNPYSKDPYDQAVKGLGLSIKAEEKTTASVATPGTGGRVNTPLSVIAKGPQSATAQKGTPQKGPNDNVKQGIPGGKAKQGTPGNAKPGTSGGNAKAGTSIGTAKQGAPGNRSQGTSGGKQGPLGNPNTKQGTTDGNARQGPPRSHPDQSTRTGSQGRGQDRSQDRGRGQDRGQDRSQDRGRQRDAPVMQEWQKKQLLQNLPSHYTQEQVAEFFGVLVTSIETLAKLFQDVQKFTLPEIQSRLSPEEIQMIYTVTNLTGVDDLSAARIVMVLHDVDPNIVEVIGNCDMELIQSLVQSSEAGAASGFANLLATMTGQSDSSSRGPRRPFKRTQDRRPFFHSKRPRRF